MSSKAYHIFGFSSLSAACNMVAVLARVPGVTGGKNAFRVVDSTVTSRDRKGNETVSRSFNVEFLESSIPEYRIIPSTTREMEALATQARLSAFAQGYMLGLQHARRPKHGVEIVRVTSNRNDFGGGPITLRPELETAAAE